MHKGILANRYADLEISIIHSRRRVGARRASPDASRGLVTISMSAHNSGGRCHIYGRPGVEHPVHGIESFGLKVTLLSWGHVMYCADLWPDLLAPAPAYEDRPLRTTRSSVAVRQHRPWVRHAK